MPLKAKRSPKARSASKPKLEAVLRTRVLDEPHIVHGFSTRLKPGNAPKSPASTRSGVGLQLTDFNLGFVDGFPREAVERNRAAFIRAVDGGPKPAWALVQMKQIHSDIIHVLRAAPEHPLNGDGLV